MPEVSPPAGVVFYLPGSIPVHSTVLAARIASAVLVLISVLATRRMALVPSGLQNFVEFAVESLLSLCEQVAGRQGRAFLPLVGTLFLFIVTANWMGILPLYAESNWEHHHVSWTASHDAPLRSANSDLSVTAAMGALVFLWVQVTRIRANGLFGWVKHLTWGPPPLLELISEISRPVSLSLRLFGNIFAGVVMVTLIGLLPPLVLWLPDVLWKLFELFIGVIQAFIFALLTIIYFSFAAGSEEEAH